MPGAQRTIGRYEVVREIGRGGMAVVYLARQPDLDRDVALKELASFHALDPSFAERFAREARVGGALAHPSIVTVFEAFEHGGVPYIAMEHMARGSLRPLIGSLSLAQVAGVLEGLLAGLDHAGAREIVHRDLKPENVLVSAEGRVKIADFGIAKAYNRVWTAHYRTATGMALGTPTYMAPEQAMGREVGVRTDLYAVGVMAYEMLSGRPPFHDIDEPMAILLRHVSEPAPPLAGVDPGLAGWVERLLAKEPEARPAGAQAAWEQLEEIVVRLLGPLWRREARLLAPAAAGDSRPLTPAPFEESPDYRTFGAAPSPPAAAEAPAPTPPATPELAPTTPPATAAPPPATVEPTPPASPPPASPPPVATSPPAATPPPAASPRERPRGRRGALAAAAAVVVAAAAVGVAAVGGAFGGGAQPTGAARAASGLPPCFTKLVSHAIELPTGVDVPMGSLRKATGRTFTFLLESGKPIGAVTASVHGGAATFFRIENLRDTGCSAVNGTAVNAPEGYPNLKNYDQARAKLAGTTYDFELQVNSGKLSASLSVPKRPAMTVSARRAGGRLTAQGTLPSGAYGDVTLTYRARQADGTRFQRSVTVTASNGAFGGSWPLGAAGRRLGRGTISAAFVGDSNFLPARARTTVR